MKFLLMVVAVLAVAYCAAMFARRLLQLRARTRELALWDRWHRRVTRELEEVADEQREELRVAIRRGCRHFDRWFREVATPKEIVAYEQRRQELRRVVE